MSKSFKVALIGVRILCVLLLLMSCNPSQQALWEKDKATGYGGLTRHIRVINTITGQVVYDKIGRCFVDDSSSATDAKILWTTDDYKNTRKDDILGSHFLLIAEEVPPLPATVKESQK